MLIAIQIFWRKPINAAKHALIPFVWGGLMLLISGCAMQVVETPQSEYRVFKGEKSTVIVDLVWDDVTRAFEELKANNLHIVDIETYRVDNKQLFGAVWHRESPKTMFYRSGLGASGNDWRTFEGLWTSMKNDGMRLIDIDIYQDAGQYYALSIWQEGRYDIAIRVNVKTGSEFDVVRDGMLKNNMVISDFEPYDLAGSVFYVAVFRSGRVDDFFKSVGERGFRGKFGDNRNGFELMDLEIYREKSSDKESTFAGAWKPGNVPQRLEIAVDWERFLERCAAFEREGLYLNDLEIESRSSRPYSGVWSSQNIGR